METHSDLNTSIFLRFIWTSLIGIAVFAGYAFYALLSIDLTYRHNDYSTQEANLFFLARTFLLISTIYSVGEWFILGFKPYRYRFALLWIIPNALLGMFCLLNLLYNPLELSRFQLISVSAISIGSIQGLLLQPYIKHWYLLILVHGASLSIPILLINYFNGTLWLFSLPIVYSLISSIAWWLVLRYAQREPAIHQGDSFVALLKRYPSVAASSLCVLAFSLVMLFSWKEVWKPTPPAPPIYASAVEVITDTSPFSKRNPTNEKYAMVIRLPVPTAGHQLQIVILTTYQEAYLEPVDRFYYSLETQSLSSEQQQELTRILQEWCTNPPKQPSSSAQLEVALRCNDQVIGFALAVEDTPEALLQLFRDLRVTKWTDTIFL